MRKLLALVVLLLGSQQSSAQTLPFYNSDYEDSAQCEKDGADELRKNKDMANVADSLGKSMCNLQKAFNNAARDELEKRWNQIPSAIRSQCIADLAEWRKQGQIKNEDYRALDICITELTKSPPTYAPPSAPAPSGSPSPPAKIWISPQ